MISETDQILSMINAKSNVVPMVGRFVSATATGCIVDVGGGRIPAQFGSTYLPEINESVWIWFVDGLPFLVGSSTAKPGNGTVVSAASGLVTLSTAYGTIIVPYASTLTPTAGQIMKLSWQEGGFAHSVMSTLPTPPVAPSPPPVTATAHVHTFMANDAGSYNGSWWTPQVYSLSNNVGCWFFGSKISDTIPASASIISVAVYCSIQAKFSSAPSNFGVHTYTSKPGGAPSVTSDTPTNVAPGWISLPTSFGDALKAGGGQSGVGVDSGGYTILSSLGQDGMTGALQITSVY